jgi:hypothetical protein
MDAYRHSSRSCTALRISRLPALALLVGLPACSSWRPIDLAPSPAFGERAVVRVESANGTLAVIEQALVVRDSIVGVAERTSTPIAVPLADVGRAWELRFSGKRTALLLASVVGVLMAIAAYGASTIPIAP